MQKMFLLFLCFPFCAYLQSQSGPPDLSGIWKLNVSKSKLDGRPTPKVAAIYEIKHSGKSIHIIAKWDSGTTKYAYVIDGKKFMMLLSHSRMIAQAHWEDRTLVVEGEDMESRQKSKWIKKYSISDDGEVLTIKGIYVSPGWEEVLTLDKQQ